MSTRSTSGAVTTSCQSVVTRSKPIFSCAALAAASLLSATTTNFATPYSGPNSICASASAEECALPIQPEPTRPMRISFIMFSSSNTEHLAIICTKTSIFRMFGVFLFCWIQYRPNTLLCHCIQFSHSIQKLLRYKKAGRKGIAFRPAKWMQRYKAWLGWNVMCACNTVNEYLLEVHQKLPYCKAMGLDMLCRAQKSRWTGQQTRTVSGSAGTVAVKKLNAPKRF